MAELEVAEERGLKLRFAASFKTGKRIRGVEGFQSQATKATCEIPGAPFSVPQFACPANFPPRSRDGENCMSTKVQVGREQCAIRSIGIYALYGGHQVLMTSVRRADTDSVWDNGREGLGLIMVE